MATVPRKKKQKSNSNNQSTKSITGINSKSELHIKTSEEKKKKKDKKKKKEEKQQHLDSDSKNSKIKTEKPAEIPGKHDKSTKQQKSHQESTTRSTPEILPTSSDGYQIIDWQIPVICYFSWVFKDLFVAKDLSIPELTACLQPNKYTCNSTISLHTFVLDLLSGIFGLNTRLTCPKKAHKLLLELYTNHWDNHEYELQSVKCTQLDRATILRARRRFFGTVPPILENSTSSSNKTPPTSSKPSLDPSSFSSIDPNSNKNLFYQLTYLQTIS